jgi:hypothetical protein
VTPRGTNRDRVLPAWVDLLVTSGMSRRTPGEWLALDAAAGADQAWLRESGSADLALYVLLAPGP